MFGEALLNESFGFAVYTCRFLAGIVPLAPGRSRDVLHVPLVLLSDLHRACRL